MILSRLISISRPRFWMYTFGSYLIGIGAATTLNDAARVNPDILLWLIYLTLPANLFAYGINDLADSDTDAFNPKKGTYEASVSDTDRRPVLAAILILHILFVPVMLRASSAEIICLSIFILANIAYSLRPLRLKARPFLDSGINAVFCVAVGLMGYFAAGGSEILWPAVVAGGLWSAVMHAYSAIPDIEADRAARVGTIATVLGAERTLVVSGFGYILAGLCLLVAGLPYHALLLIPYLVLIGVSFVRYRKKLSIFPVYAAYPVVTLIVGGLVYFLNSSL